MVPCHVVGFANCHAEKLFLPKQPVLQQNIKEINARMQAFLLQTKESLPCSGTAMTNIDQSAFRVAYEVVKM